MMKMYIIIKERKIYDICSDLRHKRDNSISDKDYLNVINDDLCINDNWNFENSVSLKDSPQRFIEPEMTELELLKERIKVIEELLKIT